MQNDSQQKQHTRSRAAREKVEEQTGWNLWSYLTSENTLWSLAVLILMAGALYLILTAGRPPLQLEMGEVARADHRARVGFTCTDKEATRQAEQRARREVPAVFQVNPTGFHESFGQFVTAVQEGRGAGLWDRIGSSELRSRFLSVLPSLREDPSALRELSEKLEGELLYRPGATASEVLDRRDTARMIGPSGERRREVPVSSLTPLTHRPSRFRSATREALEGLEPAQQETVLRVMVELLEPSVRPDAQATHRLARRAAEEVRPREKTFEKGALIISAGTTVRPHHLYELKQERQHYWGSAAGAQVDVARSAGILVLIVVLLGIAAAYVWQHEHAALQRTGRLFAFALFTLGFVAVARLLYVYGLPLLLVPVPLMVMTLCLVYNHRFGFYTAVFYGLLLGCSTGGTGVDFIVLTVGGMVVALYVGRVRARSALIEAGIASGVLQGLTVIALAFLQRGQSLPLEVSWESQLMTDAAAALANGVLSGFLLSGLLPAVEQLFGVTTDIRLLEWSDPTEPLLQRLLLDAPGTYHHSMLVGSLAGEAADATGANSLLARVGAYYHDIGKLDKPEYFVENVAEDEKNPHSELSPTMSNLIITSHPKNGAEMAQQYGLPGEVRDIILQSHGSSVVKYFYQRAKQEKQEGEELSEESFRYRLPKPQSKEAAIVMLSDCAEGATRSLEKPSPAKIENVVREVVLDKLHDGQLDESGLSLTDLKNIQQSLARGLTAIFHKRVEYPEQQEEAEETRRRELAAAGGTTAKRA
ncbi:MAG: HDIG domain-containing metalloprotein [Planctomycetota bacterium]